jgi:hypothetical protein
MEGIPARNRHTCAPDVRVYDEENEADMVE